MILFASPKAAPILTTDSFGVRWVPGFLLEIRNGVALVQIGDYQTVRPLTEVRGSLFAPPFWERTSAGPE
jgi:hypothetical protein